jgi:hypothetical protein
MYFHYKIYIHEKCLQNEIDKFQKILSQHSKIDARGHYWAVARWLRSPVLMHNIEPIIQKLEIILKPRCCSAF